MNQADIWNFANHTDPSATKKIELDGRIVTSINGTYIAKKATELFGPIGIGWGYEIIEERYDKAGPIYDPETKAFICDALNHTVVIKFWYVHNDKRGEFTHYGHTKYLYKTRYGYRADDEAPKKSLTDAIKKCLSMLGFCADIYLGQFDDDDYVSAQWGREQLEKAENKIEEENRQRQERAEWLENNLRLIGEAVSLSMLEGVFKTAVRRAKIHKDNEALLQLTKAKDKKKQELSK